MNSGGQWRCHSMDNLNFMFVRSIHTFIKSIHICTVMHLPLRRGRYYDRYVALEMSPF